MFTVLKPLIAHAGNTALCQAAQTDAGVFASCQVRLHPSLLGAAGYSHVTFSDLTPSNSQWSAQIKRFPGRVLRWRSREHSLCLLLFSRLTVSRWGRRRSRGNGTKIRKRSRLRTLRWSTGRAAPARRSSPASTRLRKREKQPQPQRCAAPAVSTPPSLQPLTARSWRFTRSLDQITWLETAQRRTWKNNFNFS